MPFKVNCPHCGREGSLSNPVAPGTPVRCPGCRNQFEIPAGMESAPMPKSSAIVQVPPFPDRKAGVQEPVPDFLAERITGDRETSEHESSKLDAFLDSLNSTALGRVPLAPF